MLGAHDRALELLTSREAALRGLAKALLEKETLDGAEIDVILREYGAETEPTADAGNTPVPDARKAETMDPTSEG